MSNNNFWENMGRLMARKLAINGKQVNSWNPVDSVQILIDAAQRKPPKVNTATKTAQPQNMVAGRMQGGYEETGGAQSQAYRGRAPGSTHDKTKQGIYTPYTETGGAQGQAITAPGTGNEGFDMLPGKGKHAGVYNKWNRPSDTILLAKILESAKLPKSANMLYNGAESRNAGGAQGQAYRGRAPGSAYDKIKPGTYTPYIETGGAQGQATGNKKKAANNTEEPKHVGEYISEEDYNQQSDVFSRQLEASGKFIDEFAKMLQLHQGNMDPEAVRMYEQAQAGYNRNLELQSELQKMMDTLQSNRDYSVQAEEAEKNDKFFDTDVDAAHAFAEEAIPLTYRSNNEYAAIMTVEWVPENRDGELLLVPKYTYNEIMEGKHGNVINIALAGLLVQTEGKKYLLHTHPKSSWIDEDGKTRKDRPDYFSGAPYNLLNMGDASIPTLAGADWYEAPNVLNSLPVPLYQFIKNIAGLSISGYDGIYLCSPNGKLYYYEGTGEGEYQANTQDELENKIYNDPVANDFPKIHGYKDYDTNTIYPD